MSDARTRCLPPESMPTPRRPWARTAKRMRQIVASHPDPKVRAYAQRWLETYDHWDGEPEAGTA